MNCEEALVYLSGHLDGQNTPEEEALLQAHLESCPSCREILSAYEEIDAGVAALETEPPRELISGVMEQITQRPAERPARRRLIFGSGTAIAAVAAVLLLLVSTGKLPNFRQGKAAPVTQSESSDVTPAVSQAKTFDVEESSLEAPYDEADAAPQAAAGNAAAKDDRASLMAADQPLDAPVLEIVDDPASPAASVIAELAQMPAEAAEDGGSMQYWTDAATARTIAAAYAETYAITVPDTLDAAEDRTPCAIRVVEP